MGGSVENIEVVSFEVMTLWHLVLPKVTMIKCLKRYGLVQKNYAYNLDLQICELNKEHLEFYGYVFSAEGVSPSPKKVKAIKNACDQQMPQKHGVS